MTTSGVELFYWIYLHRLCRHISDQIASRFIKFCKIPLKSGNSVAMGKFQSSSQNFTTREKLWVLVIRMQMHT